MVVLQLLCTLNIKSIFRKIFTHWSWFSICTHVGAFNQKIQRAIRQPVFFSLFALSFLSCPVSALVLFAPLPPSLSQYTVVGKWDLLPSTFDLYLYLQPGWGHGVQGAWGPQLAMNRFLPLLATQIPTLWIHTSGGSDIRSMSSIRPICKCRCPPLRVSTLWLSPIFPFSMPPSWI